MRVLLTTDTVGGVWTFTKELTEQLLSRGDSVALVSFGQELSTKQTIWADSFTSLNNGAFEYHACDVPLEWMQNNDLVRKQGGEFLQRVADKFQPDLLHSSQYCWGALPLDVPKLLTAHSDVRSWAAACRPDGLTPSRWLHRYDTLVQDGMNGADALVAPTAWMRDALLQHFKVAQPFHVIANGRTLPNLDLRRQRELQAVSVGRLWDEGKGLGILSEISSPFKIILAGEANFEDARNGLSRSGPQSLGKLDETSVVNLFCKSSIYLATSLYEPFGLATLEAALCGCAIVARNLPAFREVWGSAALYFDSAMGLEDVLSGLRNNAARLYKFRLAAAERAHHFTAQRMANGYISLYRELIVNSSGGKSKVEEELHAA